jgi:hypothetical protein
MGIHIQAGKGSGKSRLMGRILAWLDFLRGIPVIIFDPHGQTIDNFLDKIIRTPPEYQPQLWSRVHYVDMSGSGDLVCPFPLYYRLGEESLYEISQRPLDTIRKIDPHLQTASIEGWNALWRTGTYAGMLLAALGYQFTEAEYLLMNPLAWQGHFKQLVERYPELRSPVAFFRQLGDPKNAGLRRRTESFANKTTMFSLDPTMKAMFGANLPGIDWNQLERTRPAILLDFRHEHDIERRRFKMMWAFLYCLEFIKYRGAGRHVPISFIIDELTSLFSIQALAADLFASDIDELINVIARNYSIWLCIAHQEAFQFSERLQKSLMTMGTQVLGVTSDPDSAINTARQFSRYDPYWVKKYERVWMSDMIFGAYVVDHRSVEFTIDEQLLIHSYEYLDQGRFRFRVRPAAGEGDVTGGLHSASIEGLDPGIYPHEELVPQARALLMERDGRPVRAMVAEIEERQANPRLIEKPTKKRTKKHAKPSIRRSGLVDVD